ncbi:MAG: TlpA disulfide reductase family protein [Gammaproteobacteria bacterium]
MSRVFCNIFIALMFSSILLASNAVSAAATEAPSIHLPAIEGELDLASLRGKVVYLDFWASWCKPCQKSFPWMRELKSAYESRGLEVVAVNLDKDRALADSFLKQLDVNFVVAFDGSGSTASDYQLKGMPSSYLIGRDGKIYATHVGFRDQDKQKLEAAIQKLLAN